MTKTELKRGHNTDFALTDAEIEALISSTTSDLTKALMILASHGLKVNEIITWKCTDIHPLLEGIRQDYFDILTQYPHGFGISGVAVWRRVGKAILRAGKMGVIAVDPNHVPFPEALRFRKRPPEISVLKERLVFFAKRVHVLNGGPRDTRDPLTLCPHLDCIEVRALLEMISHYPGLERR